MTEDIRKKKCGTVLRKSTNLVWLVQQNENLKIQQKFVSIWIRLLCVEHMFTTISMRSPQSGAKSVDRFSELTRSKRDNKALPILRKKKNFKDRMNTQFSQH